MDRDKTMNSQEREKRLVKLLYCKLIQFPEGYYLKENCLSRIIDDSNGKEKKDFWS